MEETTIKDVARLCGVGVSTVSRAINNHPDINAATKAKIMEVIRETNYIPNNSARNLKRSESRSIAVLIKGIGNPFFQSMIQVFEEKIQEKRYTFILHRVETAEDEVEVALELIKEKRLKGIVFLGGTFAHSQEKLKQLTVPFVLSTIDVTAEIQKDVYSSVSVDNIKESARMTDYLCDQGHQQIAVLASDAQDVSVGRRRLEGYRQVLERRGIPLDEGLIRYSKEPGKDSYSMENGYELMKELLASGKAFTAVYAISDSMAIGACRALLEAGKRIPEDVAVAGFDGLDITQYYYPSITTIRQPVDEMALETIRILFGLISKKKAHRHKIFEGELQIKESTKTK